MHFKKYKNQAVLSNREWSETTTGPSHKVSSCFVSIRLLHSVSSDDEVVLHYTYGELPSVIKRIPWLTDSNKLIQAICFDPTATWLLVVCESTWTTPKIKPTPLFLQPLMVHCT
jgi:hypothetical protein